jgi:hypothetical protein
VGTRQTQHVGATVHAFAGDCFNEVASAELRAAAIAETLASPDVDAATKDRLLASALQSQRELEDLGEYEAASKYNGLAVPT